MERTPNDFVNEMLAGGRNWIAITAVASVIRDGRWKNDVRIILQERGLMPTDETEIVRLKVEASKTIVEDPPKYARESKVKVLPKIS